MKTLKKKSAATKEVAPKDPKKIGLFDILNNVNAGSTQEDLLKDCRAYSDEGASPDSIDKVYAPFMINRGLSYFSDTILFANAMNENYHLPVKMQYDFYRHALRPRKRFSKWFKGIDDTEDVEMIKREYGYSSIKAREALSLFTEEALDALRKKHDRGGKTK